MAKKAELLKTGVFQGTMITESGNTRIMGEDIVVGDNLAKNSSPNWKSYSNFSGAVNTCPGVGTVTISGLSAGDTITIHYVYKYTNIVAASGQTAKMWFQGSGNTTKWNSGSFPGDGQHTLSGSGEINKTYTITLTADHVKNSSWSVNIRHDYVQSGTVQWKDFKVEKGSVATPWIPNSSDAMYSTYNFGSMDRTITDPIKSVDFYEI